MIQERFNTLAPYLKGLKVASSKEGTYNIVEATLKRSWKVPKNENIRVEKTDSGLFFFSDSLSVDELLDWLEHDIINFNLEIEEKQRLLSAKVEELKRVFETSSLDELNKLKFTTEEDILKLNHKQETKENGITEELPKSKKPDKQEV